MCAEKGKRVQVTVTSRYKASYDCCWGACACFSPASCPAAKGFRVLRRRTSGCVCFLGPCRAQRSYSVVVTLDAPAFWGICFFLRRPLLPYSTGHPPPCLWLMGGRLAVHRRQLSSTHGVESGTVAGLPRVSSTGAELRHTLAAEVAVTHSLLLQPHAAVSAQLAWKLEPGHLQSAPLLLLFISSWSPAAASCRGCLL